MLVFMSQRRSVRIYPKDGPFFAWACRAGQAKRLVRWAADGRSIATRKGGTGATRIFPLFFACKCLISPDSEAKIRVFWRKLALFGYP